MQISGILLHATIGRRVRRRGHIIASLALMGRLNEGTISKSVKDQAIRWCIWRLNEGFHGRPNKPDDTCYTFWIGGALRLLVNSGDEIEPVIKAIASKSHQFVLSTQDAIIGGMAKWPDMTSPDPLHTYLGLSGMSLFLEPEDNIYCLLPVEEIEFVFLTVIDARRMGILEGVAGLVKSLDESRDTESKDAGPDDGIGRTGVIFS